MNFKKLSQKAEYCVSTDNNTHKIAILDESD